MISFSIPAILGMLIDSLYNIIDRIFIGNHPEIGDVGISAITIGFPIIMLIMCPIVLFGVGGSTLFSLRQGEGKHEDVGKAMGNSFVLLVISTLALSVICMIFLEKILLAFQTQPDIIDTAIVYYQTILAGSVFSAIATGMNNFVRANGAPRTAMLTMFFGAGLNIVLDYIFIYIFNMGLFGAAFATCLSQFFSAVWVMCYLTGKRCNVKLKFEHMKLDLAIIRRTCIIGMPSFLLEIVCCYINILLNGLFSFYGGSDAIYGIGVINALQSIMYMPSSGISQGAQPIFSYNFGAKRYDRVVKTLKISLIVTTVVFIAGWLLTTFGTRWLVLIFDMNATDEQLISYTVHAIHIWFAGFPILGIQLIGTNFFQSIGRSTLSTVLALSRQVLILTPALLILPHILPDPLDGVLISAPLCDVLSSVLTLSFLIPEVKKLNKMNKSIG